MTQLILVTYATEKGSTEEVAGEVAASLSAHGLATDLRAAKDVRTLDGYDGVVLGSAIYTGRLHREARAFLRRHRERLSALPVAIFAMGPRTLGAADLASSRAQLDRALAKEPEVQPFSTAIFGGAFDPAQHHFPFNHMPAADARDWNAIRAWAIGLADQLRPARTA